MSAFDLRQNAFALLASHPRANRVQLEDAYHDVMLDAEDHADEERFNRAQQSLISPRDRLENELSFFIDAKPATIKKIVNGLNSADAYNASESLIGLDRANLLAHLCYTDSGEQRRMRAFELVEAYDEIDQSQVSDTLKGSRSVSGFGTVDEVALKAGLNKVYQAHAVAALQALLSDKAGGLNHVSELAGALVDCGPRKRVILEAVLKEFEAQISPRLEAGADEVRRCLTAVADSPDDVQLIEEVDDALRRWDRHAQPLQTADRVRGIDEHHSRQLFEEVRDTCLSLANERGLYRQALAITHISQHVFAELPDAAAKLAQDEATLVDLVDEKEKSDIVAPVAVAVAAAQANHSSTCRALQKAGFQPGAPSPVGEVARSFLSVVSGANDEEVNGLAAQLVRKLGIDVCNEANDNVSAFAIVNGLLQHRSVLPADVVSALQNDRLTIQRNIDFNSMTDAMKAGRLDEADKLAERMLDGADDETHGTLIGVRAVLAQKKRSRRNKLIGWGIFAAFILFVIVSGNESKNSSSYTDNAYTPTYEEPGPAADPITVIAPSKGSDISKVTGSPDPQSVDSTEPSVDNSSSTEETPPSPYQSNNTVSLPELRYCKRQKARIEGVQNDVGSRGQIARYNAAIDDYNSRCGSFRYRQSDLDQVDREVANDSAKLQAEGHEIIGGSE